MTQNRPQRRWTAQFRVTNRVTFDLREVRTTSGCTEPGCPTQARSVGRLGNGMTF